MKSFVVTAIQTVANAWLDSKYAAYLEARGQYGALQSAELGEPELPYGHQLANKWTTEVKTSTDRTDWRRPISFEGVNSYTHNHHGYDASYVEATADHLYSAENTHYHDVDYLDR